MELLKTNSFFRRYQGGYCSQSKFATMRIWIRRENFSTFKVTPKGIELLKENLCTFEVTINAMETDIELLRD